MKIISEKDIVAYLKEKYHPKAIILVGSRASGTEGKESDWDVYLFCSKKYTDGFFPWRGTHLDLSFCPYPAPKGYYLSALFAPAYPFTVLYDGTKGKLFSVLLLTETNFHAGPLVVDQERCAGRLEKLERWRGKVIKHRNDPDEQFYYACYVYEFLVRIWFEQQNLWPPPPAQAFPFIKENDPVMGRYLSQFPVETGEKRILLMEKMIARLHQIKKRKHTPIRK